MLFVLILVVLIGGNDGLLVDMPSVRNGERGNDKVLCQVQQAEARVDGTPDWITRSSLDTGVPLRVASVEAGYTVEDTVLVESAATPPPEGGVDGLWRITIYCCKGDDTGAYCSIEEGGRATAAGLSVAPGMAACSLDWGLGTSFAIPASGDVVVCRDRGGAVTSPYHLDVWFYDCGIQEDPAPGTGWWWLQRVGDRAIVEVLQ